MSEAPPPGTLGTINNAATLLELLSGGPAHHQITDLAERSAMSLPTVHRLLRSLVAAGFVEQDPRSSRYGLGPQLLRLAEHYVSRLPAVKAATPYLVELRNQTRATVAASILVDTDAVRIDRIDGDDVGGVYRDAARVQPALSCASGRVLLAHAPDEIWKQATSEAATPPSDTDRDAWRDAAYVVVDGVGTSGQTEVAVPVHAADGTVATALSATDDPATFTTEHITSSVVPHLTRAARAVAKGLAHG